MPENKDQAPAQDQAPSPAPQQPAPQAQQVQPQPQAQPQPQPKPNILTEAKSKLDTIYQGEASIQTTENEVKSIGSGIKGLFGL